MSENLLPEQKARQKIDEMLTKAGWDIISRNEYSDIYNGCAITEALLTGNLEADYLLFVGGKAIGVLEAKRAENNLSIEVAEQAQNYTKSLPDWYQTWSNPLPFVFLSNGETLLFRDMREEDTTYIELKKMKTPKELVQMADIQSEYAALPALPPVGEKGLRQCQYDAIRNLELAFKQNETKALISLATGAGKTFTACTFTYRFLTYTSVRRVLFLVDRNNLGKQAEGEFTTYKLTESGEVFNSIYSVQRLKSIEEIQTSKVVISTIQRLFSAITGQTLTAENDDDESDYADALYDAETEDEVTLDGKVLLPPDFFDLIIVDECHRSIYGKWQQVLKYFKNAKIIGLTATPTPEAEAFFNHNFVANYTFEDSVRDGVNVPPRVYRIKTKVSENGGTIEQNEKVYKKSKLTGKTEVEKNPDKEQYTTTQLDRTVVNKTEIKKVVKAFKDSIYTSLYPDRYPDWNYIPKTLFFAKSDSHANDIIEQIKEVFGEEFPDGLPEQYVQKITYNAGNSNELIRQLRNNKEFRIAVTVTLVATGTDVKPLECVVFMRDVASSVLYTQMKGRGCRRISDDNLQLVTPNALSKDCFYVIDAVGVTEHEHHIPEVQGGDGPTVPVPSLQRLLELLALGNVSDEYLTLLSNYLAKCQNKGEAEDLKEWAEIAGITLKDFVDNLVAALEQDTFATFESLAEQNQIKTSMKHLPPYTDINAPNTERKQLISKLITNNKARQKILEINAGFVKILMPGEDELTYTGFSKEESETYIQTFEKYMDDNKDKIEALRIIYNEEDIPITHKMLEDLQTNLLKANGMYKPSYIWQNYKVVKADDSIVPLESKNELEALTNLIQIARYVYGKSKTLTSLFRGWKRGFALYSGQEQRSLTQEQLNLMEIIAEYIVQNGAVEQTDIFNGLGSTYSIELVKTFGKDNVNSELTKLAGFVLRDYTSKAA
ncbi:MAG: DEAD/DEAH box helicase family protein [Treponema sp.]|nr:DEAD/DEAH box helicase family protein [Treponema sp.]